MVVSSGNGLTLVALAFVGKRIDLEQSDGVVEPAVVHPVERLYRSPIRVDEHSDAFTGPTTATGPGSGSGSGSGVVLTR